MACWGINLFMSEIDILNLDSKIQDYFNQEQKKLRKYREKLVELDKTRKTDGIPVTALNEIDRNISSLTEKINNISLCQDQNFYLSETTQLLERYREILKVPQKISFCRVKTDGKTSSDEKHEKSDRKEKNKIIAEYLKIAQKYCPEIHTGPCQNYSGNGKEYKSLKLVCNNCPNKKDFIIDENCYICPDCYSQQELLQNVTSYKDADRVNISTKYTYDRKVHFRDCINQYQGKQNCSIDQKVYDDLEDIFDRHHLLIGDKTTRKEDRFSRITKEHIIMFLKELEYNKHYENVFLIHYNLTGKKPDDISYLEEKLIADFDLLLETYDTHFKHMVDRVNFISTQFVLYQLLQKHHHPCKKEDFVTLKTIDRKEFHDTICGELFAKNGWNYRPCF